jgi:hypothetical protein
MDSKPVKPSKMRVHKGMLLMLLPGIDSVDAAHASYWKNGVF